tara:strand:- start:63 stop:908 length:846 start_codon:yes stop_codon:yes gene_type:complete
MSLEEKNIEINGLAINYVEGGFGQAMIFLHNGGGFWQSWEHQIKHFAKDYNVFGIDWPGFGKSDMPNGLISLDLLTETLNEFIRILNLKNIILVGNCIGGSAALNYNMGRPDMVHKLLIFNICPGDLIFRLPIMRRYVSHLNSRKRSKSILGSILIFGFTKTLIKRKFPCLLFGNKVDKDSALFKRYVEKFKLKTQTKSRVNMVFSVHTFNLLSFLGEKKAPEHLLAWGEFNKVTSLKIHGYYHYNLLQSKKFELIKNAGHLCMYESPQVTNDIIERYIRK